MDPTMMVPENHTVYTELDLALSEAEISEIQYPVARTAELDIPGEEAYDLQILAGLVMP